MYRPLDRIDHEDTIGQIAAMIDTVESNDQVTGFTLPDYYAPVRFTPERRRLNLFGFKQWITDENGSYTGLLDAVALAQWDVKAHEMNREQAAQAPALLLDTAFVLWSLLPSADFDDYDEACIIMVESLIFALLESLPTITKISDDDSILAVTKFVTFASNKITDYDNTAEMVAEDAHAAFLAVAEDMASDEPMRDY